MLVVAEPQPVKRLVLGEVYHVDPGQGLGCRGKVSPNSFPGHVGGI